MKTLCPALTLVFILSSHAFAQTTEKLAGERYLFNPGLSIFGNGSILSMDLETAIKVKSDMHLCLRTGIGQNIIRHSCPPLCEHTREYDLATLPFQVVTIIYVSKRNKGIAFIEFGLGTTLAFIPAKTEYLFYPVIGYRVYPFRYLPLHYRIFTHLPLFPQKSTHFQSYYSPFGLSIGYSL